ncbi:MAG TPA: cobalamin-independent methionine synthase II family protein [Stellaceae bacterium]|jgi:5-methyltetrahydropteroyltriglutamate--homocysteine methyltransferase|nr:cobalamin-independent methionine synthase II family protein [Stellaceae bacterium]
MASGNRIRVTHAGALPRSPDLHKLVWAKGNGTPYDAAELESKLNDELAATIRRQVDIGIDSINDGELSKTSFTQYCASRMAGYEVHPYDPSRDPEPLSIGARDIKKFREYFANGHAKFVRLDPPKVTYACTGPLSYVGQDELNADLQRFKDALAGVDYGEAYVPANSPGTIEHWLRNQYYKTEEEFVEAIAETMRTEYKAIVDAGFRLQIDDPDMPDGWLMYPDMSIAEYRKYARLRAEALNHALRGLPREKIRLHVCWGSFHGPHSDDIPLKDIADIVFSIRASEYSIEASNPAHEHEWAVFQSVGVPEDAALIPGVVGHCTDFIENPELVAQRLTRYAHLVGRENVMAGTDCGMGPRVNDPKICWAKFEAMVEGARLATKHLWAKGSSASRAKPAVKKAAKKKAAKKAAAKKAPVRKVAKKAKAKKAKKKARR